MASPTKGLTPLAGLTVFLWLMSAGGRTWAQDDPSVLAAARSLGVEGVKLADAGNCSEAVDRLERAERLHHAPTTLGRLGECYVTLGHLVRGSEVLLRVVREPLAANAPAPFVAARARAQRVLEQAKPRIAMLRIVVETSGGAPPTLTPEIALDGEPLPSAFLEVDRPTDPGEHVVSARLAGYAERSEAVHLGEGQRAELRLTLTPLPPEAIPARSVDARAAGDERVTGAPVLPYEPPPPADARRAVGITLIGVGGASVIAGGVFGLLALGTKGDLDDVCGGDKVCPPSERDTISAMKTQGTFSTAGFVLGGLALVSGTVLLLTTPSRSASPRGPRGAGAPALQTTSSGQSLFLEGRF